MFGRLAYLPVDVDCEKAKAEERLENWQQAQHGNDGINMLISKRQRDLETAKMKILEAQEKQKHYYDLKHCKPGAFDIGSQVLMKDLTRKKRKGGKLDTKWIGPFQIQKNLGKALTGVKNSTLKINRVHGTHLKPYFVPENSNSSLESSHHSSCHLSMLDHSSRLNCFSPQREVSSLSSQPHHPDPDLSSQSKQSDCSSNQLNLSIDSNQTDYLSSHSGFVTSTPAVSGGFFPKFRSTDLSPIAKKYLQPQKLLFKFSGTQCMPSQEQQLLKTAGNPDKPHKASRQLFKTSPADNPNQPHKAFQQQLLNTADSNDQPHKAFQQQLLKTSGNPDQPHKAFHRQLKTSADSADQPHKAFQRQLKTSADSNDQPHKAFQRQLLKTSSADNRVFQQQLLKTSGNPDQPHKAFQRQLKTSVDSADQPHMAFQRQLKTSADSNDQPHKAFQRQLLKTADNPDQPHKALKQQLKTSADIDDQPHKAFQRKLLKTFSADNHVFHRQLLKTSSADNCVLWQLLNTADNPDQPHKNFQQQLLKTYFADNHVFQRQLLKTSADNRVFKRQLLKTSADNRVFQRHLLKTADNSDQPHKVFQQQLTSLSPALSHKRKHTQLPPPSSYKASQKSKRPQRQQFKSSETRHLIFPEQNELGLTVSDLEQLVGGEWLTDKHINAVNKLFHKQFPSLNGFQDPITLASAYAYNSPSKNFIQIVNISNNHWVCASNVLCMPGSVEVYDSKPSCSIGAFVLHKQIAKILKTAEKSFEVKHVDVQRQRGGSDCALFAIAYATTLCLGGDPHISRYVQNNLRAHLAKCFQSQTITEFPAPERPRRGRKRSLNIESISVYCICRLPWNMEDSEKGPLAQCASCREWYHKVCLKINKDIFTCPKLKYYCNNCLM